MNTSLLHFRPGGAALAVLAGWLVLAAAGASAADKKEKDEKKSADPKEKVEETAAPYVPTNAVLAKIEFPRAVFETDITAGKDPFYPASTRRLPKGDPPPPHRRTSSRTSRPSPARSGPT